MRKDTYDHLERRCPRLGGPVTFYYCRTCGDNMALCGKISDCWWEYFDVISYGKENLSASEFDAMMTPEPVNKVTSLVELIRKAQAGTKQTEDG